MYDVVQQKTSLVYHYNESFIPFLSTRISKHFPPPMLHHTTILHIFWNNKNTNNIIYVHKFLTTKANTKNRKMGNFTHRELRGTFSIIFC